MTEHTDRTPLCRKIARDIKRRREMRRRFISPILLPPESYIATTADLHLHNIEMMLFATHICFISAVLLMLVAIDARSTVTLRPAKRTRGIAPDPSYQNRQVTTKQIRERRNARRVKSLVKRNEGCAAATPVYPSGQAGSSGPSEGRNYPSCPGEAGTGYARYDRW